MTKEQLIECSLLLVDLNLAISLGIKIGETVKFHTGGITKSGLYMGVHNQRATIVDGEDRYDVLLTDLFRDEGNEATK